ncbi:hypothetical protein D3C86_1549340 [compost metagenome]
MLLNQRFAKQHAEASGELVERHTVTVQHFVDHGLHRNCAFQHVIGPRPPCRRQSGARMRNVVPGKSGKGLEDLFEKNPLDAFALQAQVTHRLKVNVLFGAITGSVGHFEQDVVGVIEEFLQALSKLQHRLVAHLKQNHRQAGERRMNRLIGSRLVQRHYIPVVVHPAP